MTEKIKEALELEISRIAVLSSMSGEKEWNHDNDVIIPQLQEALAMCKEAPDPLTQEGRNVSQPAESDKINLPDEIWITHNPAFPNKNHWYSRGNDPENYTRFFKEQPAPDLEELKREVLKEYGGNGIVNRSTLEDIEWAIDHLAATGRIVLEGWQPIETAPEDGTKIIGYDYGDFYICQWTEIGGEKMGFANESVWSNPYANSFREYSPTHWMPLPEPPAQNKGTE